MSHFNTLKHLFYKEVLATVKCVSFVGMIEDIAHPCRKAVKKRIKTHKESVDTHSKHTQHTQQRERTLTTQQHNKYLTTIQ